MIGTYVYCLVSSAKPPRVGRVPAGVPGAGRPRAIAGPPGFWLVVADVPLDGYGAGEVNRRLNDLEWVGARALGHEAVVEHFARRHTVVPMKLFTIFRDDARAAAHVKALRGLRAIAKRIAGRAEWSVRVSRGDAARPVARRTHGARTAGVGTRFLLRKRDERDAARAAAASAARLAEDVYRTLSRVASDSLRKEDGPAGTNLLLDAAFLVSRARQRQFEAALRKLAVEASHAACTVSVTGPWPAYHFVKTR